MLFQRFCNICLALRGQMNTPRLWLGGLNDWIFVSGCMVVVLWVWIIDLINLGLRQEFLGGSSISVFFQNYAEGKRKEAFLRPFNGLHSVTTSKKIQKQASGNTSVFEKCKKVDQGHKEECVYNTAYSAFFIKKASNQVKAIAFSWLWSLRYRNGVSSYVIKMKRMVTCQKSSILMFFEIDYVHFFKNQN